MASFGTVIDFLLMLSIGGLAGLVIALHLKLRQFSAEAGKVPALADDLTRAITASRTTMQDLAKTAKTDGVRLEELNTQAERTRQELIYVLDRAEKVLGMFDNELEGRPVPRLERAHQPQTQTPTEETTSSRENTSEQTQQAHKPTVEKQAEATTNGHSKAAIMPGRYQTRVGQDQNGRPRPYKPASFSTTAAAYGASSGQQTQSTRPQSATDAESELRRALENAI